MRELSFLDDIGEDGIGVQVEVDVYPWMEEKTFTLVTSVKQLAGVVDRACAAGFCALDLETTGLDNRIREGTTIDKIVGYCLSYDGEEGFYVPVRHKGEGKSSNLDNEGVVEQIKRLTENCVTIYHNAAFDLEFLYGEGIVVDTYDRFEDTLILDYLRDSSDKRHGLKNLSERFLGMEMISLKELFPEHIKNRDFSTLDPARIQSDGKQPVLLYAGSDAICTYKLFEFYRTHDYRPTSRAESGERIFECVPVDDIKESIYKNQQFAYYIEKINIPALQWMERNTPEIDLEYLRRVRESVEDMMQRTMVEIADGFQEKGLTTFQPEDVSSPKKLGEAIQYLQDQGHITTKLTTTDTGQVGTADDVIAKLSEKVGSILPFIRKITVFRKLQKVDGTYLKPLEENTDRYNNTTRFSFLPNRVDTGRYAGSKGKVEFGYSGINVQSIPAGYNVGKFSAKKILRRPRGEGDGSASKYPNFVEAIQGDQEFLINVYDGHFIRDLVEDQEYCVRESCDGCPFEDSCERVDIPEKKEKGGYESNVKILSLDSSVRPAIKAREGYSISALDQSGVELRVAASISQEPKWIQEFYRCSSCGKEYDPPEDLTPDAPLGRKKYKVHKRPPIACTGCGSDKIGDLHTLTTKIVYGDDVVKKPDFKQYRQKAKGANFAILYGGGGGAVARATGVSREEGSFIRKKILSGLPRLNTWFDEVLAICRKSKQVITGVGRRIRLGDIDHNERWISSKAQRNAVNSIIQGTATGDLTKYCMGKVYQYMKKTGNLDNCKLIITVHDELVFEIRNDKMDELFPVIVDIMTELGETMKWPVPLACDIEVGPNFNVAYSWTAMHSINPQTGRAAEPVPKYLWNQIDMKPGMWYVEDDGTEVVIEGDPEPEEEPVEEPEPESVEEPVEEPKSVEEQEAHSDIREPHMTIKEGRKSSVRKRVKGPTFVFQLQRSPGIMQGTNTMQMRTLMRHLYQIFDFFKMENSGSHALRMVDWQGLLIIDEEERFLVDPKEFKVLAKFFGIEGQEVP